jgi:hypothetical protein
MRSALALTLATVLTAGVAHADAPTPTPAAQPAKPKGKGKAKAKPAVEVAPQPEVPAVPVTLKVVAPSAKGQWLLRIDNEGDAPTLVVADVRLLRFELRRWDAKKGAYATKGEVCDGPATFGLEQHTPFGRELVLEPGQSYVEPFDPRLLCFGKQAAWLEPGVMVMPSYGFAPRKQASWKKRKEPEVAPFVADTAKAPRAHAPIKRLVTDSLVLGDAQASVFPPYDREVLAKRTSPSTAEEASRPVPLAPPLPYQTPKDGLAAAMSLTTDRFADATSWQDIAFEVEAHNVGQRPIWIALRARQLSFMVHGTDGEAYCPRVSQDHHVPRDMFEQLQPGKHRHVGVSLAEPCAGRAFLRPGLYAVVPTLHADDNGAEYGIAALTGTVSTRDPGAVGGTHVIEDDATLVRVRSGPQPFYATSPRAIPTAEAPAAPVKPAAAR